jgi:hypothetical protein
MANNRLIEGPSLANPIIRQYVADAAITAGSWVSLDGADREVNPTVAATTVITGLAQSGAAEGGIVEVLIPQPGDIFQGTYTGTLAATDIGEVCDTGNGCVTTSLHWAGPRGMRDNPASHTEAAHRQC